MKGRAFCENLKSLRIASGLDHFWMGEHLGITRESYHDLEDHDNEIFLCGQLFQLEKLCKLFHVEIRDLFREESQGTELSRADDAKGFTIQDVSRRLAEHLESNHVTRAEFDEWADWGCSRAIDRPEEVMDWYVDTYAVVAERLGMDWQMLSFS